MVERDSMILGSDSLCCEERVSHLVYFNRGGRFHAVQDSPTYLVDSTGLSLFGWRAVEILFSSSSAES